MQEVENDISTEANSRVYELGYLLVPTLSEEEIPATFGNLKELVLSFGGVSISDEMPKMMTLAYPMTKVIANVRNKFKTGYFGWIKFTMDSGEVLKLKKKLDLDPNLVRFLIIKTVKENTFNTKRFTRGEFINRRAKIDKSKSDEVVVPINKEEIDKEIDALVAA
ncbi:MAG: 30S ribosomal protein S6 [Candidatus Pacebacteria bacterium]|nr:30S ribosomal protein S6 [Candidatus Paceibacterota bacterium]